MPAYGNLQKQSKYSCFSGALHLWSNILSVSPNINNKDNNKSTFGISLLNQVRNGKNFLLKDSTRRMTKSSNADP